MAPILLRLRTELRIRWRSWLGLALLFGVFGGAVLAVAAGARRTDSAYPRFLAQTHAWEVGVSNFLDAAVFAQVHLDQVAALPQVEENLYANLYSSGRFGVQASADPRYGVTFSALKILEGRMPRPDSAEEVSIGFLTATRYGYGLGDTIESELTDEAGVAAPVPVRFRVVGIHAAAGEFPPLVQSKSPVYATPAFVKSHPDVPAVEALFVRLRRGEADLPAFLDAMRRLAGGKVVLPYRQSEHARNVQRSFHLQAVALWLLAAFTGVAIMLVLGQALARQTLLESADYPSLRSLGMTRPQLGAVAMIRSLAIAAAGAVVATAIAFLASPIFPTGIAGIAEPAPGFAADATVLAGGAIAMVVLLSILSVPSALRAARGRGDAFGVAAVDERLARPSSADRLARGGAPASVVAGVRLAVEPGRGRTAMPVRTTLVGVTLGIAALAAAVAFDASLNRLLTTPSDYGLRWDGLVFVPLGNDVRTLAEQVAADPDVVSLTAGSAGIPFEVEGERADGLGFSSAAGSGFLTVLEGRAPRAPDEAALGTRTLAQSGKRVGDTVRLALTGTEPVEMKIVGRVVVPPIGDTGSFGEGVAVDYAAVSHIVPDGPPPDTLFLRIRPGVNPGRTLARLRRVLGRDALDVSPPDLPADLVNFGRVQNLPVILAGLFSLLAAATLVHALVAVITRRRRDLAVLKTMGFVRRQVRSAVAWQATTLAGLAVLFGVPLGIIGGRLIWTVFADQLGVLPHPRAGLTWNLLLVPTALALANVIALLPARAAARTPPALVLRTE